MATTQELLDGATCLDCGIPDGMQFPVLISLFARLAGVPADPQSLLDGAQCYACGIPPGLQLPVLIYLLNQLAGGGGGSIFGVLCGTTDPVDPPTGTCGIYYRKDTGAVFLWDGAAWQFKV